MKVKISKTGEIKAVNHGQVLVHFSDGTTKAYKSISDLSDDLKDYEEPEEFWYISIFGEVNKGTFYKTGPLDNKVKAIGNYFDTREEAEKAVEKLKAWKWLKDKGFRFTDYDYTTYKGKGCGQVFFNDVSGKYLINEMKDALDLLFGGEDE